MDFCNNKFQYGFKPMVLSDIMHFANFLNSTTEQINKLNIPKVENEGICFDEIHEILCNLVINNLAMNIQNIMYQNPQANINPNLTKFSLSNKDKNASNNFLFDFIQNINNDLLQQPTQKSCDIIPTNFIINSLHQSMYITKQTLVKLNDLFNLLRRSIDLIHKRAQSELISMNIPNNISVSNEKILKNEMISSLDRNSYSSLIQNRPNCQKKLSVVIEEKDSKFLDLGGDMKQLENVETLVKIAKFVCKSTDGGPLVETESHKMLEVDPPFHMSRRSKNLNSNVYKNESLMSTDSVICLDSRKSICKVMKDVSSKPKFILRKSNSSHKVKNDHKVLSRTVQSVSSISSTENKKNISSLHPKPFKKVPSTNVFQMHKTSKIIPLNFDKHVEGDKRLSLTEAKTHLLGESNYKLRSVKATTFLLTQDLNRKQSIDLKRTYNFVKTFPPIQTNSIVEDCGDSNNFSVTIAPSRVDSLSIIINLENSVRNTSFCVPKDECANTGAIVKLSRSAEVNWQSSDTEKSSKLSFPYSVSLASLPLEKEDYEVLHRNLYNWTYEYYMDLEKSTKQFISKSFKVYHAGVMPSKAQEASDSGISTQNSALENKLELENGKGSTTKVEFDHEKTENEILNLDLERPSPTLIENKLEKEESSETNFEFDHSNNEETEEQISNSELEKSSSTSFENKLELKQEERSETPVQVDHFGHEKIEDKISNCDLEKPSTTFTNDSFEDDSNLQLDAIPISSKGGENHKSHLTNNFECKISLHRCHSLLTIAEDDFEERSKGRKRDGTNSETPELICLHSISRKDVKKVKKPKKTSNYNQGEEKNEQTKNDSTKSGKDFDLHIPVKYFDERDKQSTSSKELPKKEACRKKTYKKIQSTTVDNIKTNQKSKRSKEGNSSKLEGEEAKCCLKEKYVDVQKANKDELNWLLKKKFKGETSLYNSDTKLLQYSLKAEKPDKLYNSECFHLASKITQSQKSQQRRKNVKEQESKYNLLRQMSKTDGKGDLIEIKNCKSSLNLFQDKHIQRTVLGRPKNGTNLTLIKNKSEDKNLTKSQCLVLGKFDSKLKRYKSVHECHFLTPNYSRPSLDLLPNVISVIEFRLSSTHLNLYNGANLSSNSNLRHANGQTSLIVKFDGTELPSDVTNNLLNFGQLGTTVTQSVIISNTLQNIPSLSMDNLLATTEKANFAPNDSPSLNCAVTNSDSGCGETKCEAVKGSLKVFQSSCTKRKIYGKKCKDSKRNKATEYWTVAKINVSSEGIQNINIIEKLPVSISEFLERKYNKK